MAVIKEARYTSPSGNDFVFSYGNVSRTTELKTGVFTYPMRDGATVQHQGRGAMTFPLACIFHGINCMEAATAFEEALVECGRGELQHPIYGTHKVRPTGNILREDQLVTGMNRSIVTITFTESLDDEDEELLNEVAADTIDENYELFEDAAAEDFAESIAAIESVEEQLAITADLEEQTQYIIDNLQPLAMSDRRSFADWLASANELRDSITQLYNRGISAARRVENAYTRALNVARLTLRLMALPSRLAVNLSSKMQGYAALTATLINQFRNDPFNTRKIINAYATAMLGLSGAVASIASGAAIGTAQASALPNQNSGVASREEAVETAGRILNMLDDVIVFSDAKIVKAASVSGTVALAALEALATEAAQTADTAKEAQEAAEVLATQAEQVLQEAPETLEGLANQASQATQKALSAQEMLAIEATELAQMAQEAQTTAEVRNAQGALETLAAQTTLAALAAQEAQDALEALAVLAAQDALDALEALAKQAAQAALAALGAFEAQKAQAKEASLFAQKVLAASVNGALVDANSVSYINLKALVFQSTRLIMNASFALPMQRVFTLDRDRQIIELCAELYGTVDNLDEFIASNNFSIDEIELLPMGTKVMHYV